VHAASVGSSDGVLLEEDLPRQAEIRAPSQTPATPPRAPNRRDASEKAPAPHSTGTYPPTDMPTKEQRPITERTPK
jgi:hypothetical protein